jgi:hypothetical protein
MTKVIFRKWKNGAVIALFPDYTNPHDRTVTSYMHIGQHGDADYGYVISTTHPALPNEYRDLLAELITTGYADLHVVQRARPNFH